MLYFYRQNEPIPINLFYPRWLIDGPSVLRKQWQIRLDNHDYSKDKPEEDRYTRDQLARGSEQLIKDVTLGMIEQLKRLPPLEHENFAMAFKNVNKTLSKRQDDKLLRLQEIPRRLPDALV